MADENFPPDTLPPVIGDNPPDDPRVNPVLASEVQAALTAQAIADRQNAGPMDHLDPRWIEWQKYNMRMARRQAIADYNARNG